MFEGLCLELRHLEANCSQPDVKIVYCWPPSQPPALSPSPASPPALPLPPFSPPPPVGAKNNMSTIESSQWAVVQTRGTDLVLGSGIAYDGAGGALVTGYFSGHASFGSTFLTSRGTEDAFVMHVTASGAIDWAVQAGDHGLFADQDDHDSSSTSHDPGYCIAHDGARRRHVHHESVNEASALE